MEKGYFDVTGASADPLYTQWTAFDHNVYTRLLAPYTYARSIDSPVPTNIVNRVTRLANKYSAIRREMMELLDELNTSMLCTPENKIVE